MARLPWSFGRVFAVASNTFRQAARMRLYPTMLLAAVGLLSSAFLFRDFNFGSSELKFIADFGFGGMSLFGSLLAIIITVQLFLGEIEHRTAIPALAKPLRRSEFVLGKFLGAFVAVGLFLLALDFCLMLVLWARSAGTGSGADAMMAGEGIDYLGVLWAGVAQIMRGGILCALALLFSSYGRSLVFAISICVLVFFAGQLQPIAEVAANNAQGWFFKSALSVANFLVPNMRAFEFGDAVALGHEGLSMRLLFLGAYAFCYIAALICLAILGFSRREI